MEGAKFLGGLEQKFDVHAQHGERKRPLGELGSLLACSYGLLHVDQSNLPTSVQRIPRQTNRRSSDNAIRSGHLLLLLSAWSPLLGIASSNRYSCEHEGVEFTRMLHFTILRSFRLIQLQHTKWLHQLWILLCNRLFCDILDCEHRALS